MTSENICFEKQYLFHCIVLFEYVECRPLIFNKETRTKGNRKFNRQRHDVVAGVVISKK